MNILNVGEKPINDNSIISKEYHSYLPYANASLNKSDEIRIPIQTQEVCTYPGESFLEIEGVVTDETGNSSTTINLINNGILFMFDEIRYELGGVVVDRVRNPGLTTLMKGYTSFTEQECIRYHNAGWNHLDNPKILSPNGYFNVCIPMKIIMGLFEDFQKIVINMRQELILIRSATDSNCVITTKAGEKPNITLRKITWKIEHIKLDDGAKIKIMDHIDSGRNLDMAFRGWELHEYPLLQQTMQHTWNVKAVHQLEKPRYVIFGFQTNRKNKLDKNISHFDHCNLSNIKIHLNSEVYPYDNLNLNFEKQQYAILYEMYARFQQSYYFYKNNNQPCLTLENFLNIAPLAVIDCSYQLETVTQGTVDIRVEFEMNKQAAADTSAFLLILHDRQISYNILKNTVKIL